MPPRVTQALPKGWPAILPDTAAISDDSLWVAGCSLEELAEEYGTPLYVYDELTLRSVARRVRSVFEPLGARVSFAAKACATLAVLRILCQEGLGLDVVSEGELQSGLRAGFQPADVHLHGNCKTVRELEAAVHLGLHAVVVDSEEEVNRLEDICRRLGSTIRIMVRLTLPLEASTHPHLQTSGRRSKFGLYHPSEAEQRVWEALRQSATLQFAGLHVHLGSQIADSSIYRDGAIELLAVAQSLENKGLATDEISVGGGWAVPYLPGGQELSPVSVAQVLTPRFRAAPGIRLAVEPGRALVARSALALYRVGSVKETAGHRVIAVDGGMGDNPRPALYGARYTVLGAARPFAPPAGSADVVGRYCESGDVLARDVALPYVASGDLLCVPVSGAYQLSMASAYNLMPQPAAILVREGQSRLIVRRATIADMLSREIVDEL